jgi:hypothetical protein
MVAHVPELQQIFEHMQASTSYYLIEMVHVNRLAKQGYLLKELASGCTCVLKTMTLASL